MAKDVSPLTHRQTWYRRAMSPPVSRQIEDRGSVKDALWEIIDAAGGVEYSRSAFISASVEAQKEYDQLTPKDPALTAPLWGGANVPDVFYAFAEVAQWTRAVKDRYQKRLLPILKDDPQLLKDAQKIWSPHNPIFEEAREFAGCSLHRYTPLHPGAGAKVVNGKLIYALPDDVSDWGDFRKNLKMYSNKEAAATVEAYWSAVCRFTDELLDFFYPTT